MPFQNSFKPKFIKARIKDLLNRKYTTNRDVKRVGNATQVIFNIPLISKSSASNWGRSVDLLQRTLGSVLNQKNPNFMAFVCGHNDPELPEFNDSRIIFLRAASELITDPRRGSIDKINKRRQINRAAAELGGGYIFMLDADDLVSNRCVDYMLQCADPNGYIIPLGYCMDFSTGRFYSVPGVWKNGFDKVNGSCAAIYCKPEDLVPGSDDRVPYIDKFVQHAKFEEAALAEGRPLHRLPFQGCIYMVNTEASLHVASGKRSTDRQAEIVHIISNHALDDCGWIHKEFAIRD